MRPIDADGIEYTHAIARCLDDGHNWNELCVTKDEIDEMPTVEAIPVKWLEDRIRLYRDCGNDLRANVIENEIELWRAKNRMGE